MQRIREQKQSFGELGIFGDSHTRLASSIRLTAHKDLARRQRTYRLHGLTHTLPIGCG
jgi:hypothetical protein